jgi:hypothetical protein
MKEAAEWTECARGSPLLTVWMKDRWWAMSKMEEAQGKPKQRLVRMVEMRD